MPSAGGPVRSASTTTWSSRPSPGRCSPWPGWPARPPRRA